MTAPDFVRRADRILVPLRVQPRAKRPGIGGTRAGRLVVRVAAAPVAGAANAAVIEALAEAAGVPRSTVRLEAGIRGLDKTASLPARAEARLRAACNE